MAGAPRREGGLLFSRTSIWCVALIKGERLGWVVLLGLCSAWELSILQDAASTGPRGRSGGPGPGLGLCGRDDSHLVKAPDGNHSHQRTEAITWPLLALLPGSGACWGGGGAQVWGYCPYLCRPRSEARQCQHRGASLGLDSTRALGQPSHP